MKRKLLKQIRSEWRSNLWMSLELLVVSVVLGYVVDYFYATWYIYTEPKGFDTEHCYRLSFGHITDKNPDYIPDQQKDDLIKTNEEILRRMEQLPFVEAASLSQNSFPYNGSNSGTYIFNDSLSSSTLHYLLRRIATPGFPKVFRYEGIRGETPEEISELMVKGEIILSGPVFGTGDDRLLPEAHIGEDFHLDGDTIHSYRLGAVLKDVRYGDFMDWNTSVLINLPHSWMSWSDEFCLRVRPEEDHDIPERLMEMANGYFHVGNRVLVNVIPFTDTRDRFQQNNYDTIRDMVVMMGFLLLNIFLGLFGTFWFRTQQRAQEIAVRKSMGATPADIFRRLITEGIVLLSIVTPLAFGIDCLLAYMEYNTYLMGSYFSVPRVLLCAAVTFGLITLMIIAGVFFPARRAQKIDPAIVLKDE